MKSIEKNRLAELKANREKIKAGNESLRDFANSIEHMTYHEKTIAMKNLSKLATPPDPEEVTRQNYHKQIDMIPLTLEQLAKVQRIHNMPEIRVTQERAILSKEDFNTLKGKNWINDKIIFVYLAMLERRSNYKTAPYRIKATSKEFWKNIVDKKFDKASSELKGIILENYGLIFVPIIENKHWSLAVIDMTRLQIDYYNSLFSEKPSPITSMINMILRHSVQNFEESHWTCRTMMGSPQQTNTNDCGVFLCWTAEYLSRARKPTFTQQDITYLRRRLTIEIFTGKLLIKYKI